MLELINFPLNRSIAVREYECRTDFESVGKEDERNLGSLALVTFVAIFSTLPICQSPAMSLGTT